MLKRQDWHASKRGRREQSYQYRNSCQTVSPGKVPTKLGPAIGFTTAINAITLFEKS